MTPPLSSSTIYYAQTFNAHCQSPRVPVHADIFTFPVVNLGNDTVVSNTSFFVLNAGTGINSYLWSTGDVSPSISVTSSGTYCVTVTSAENCSSSDCILVDITTRVGDSPNDKPVSVFPNPTIGKCTVSLPSSSKSVNFELIDMRGAIVNRFEGFQITEIDMTSLAKGIYWLRIKAESYSGMQKIVLK